MRGLLDVEETRGDESAKERVIGLLPQAAEGVASQDPASPADRACKVCRPVAA